MSRMTDYYGTEQLHVLYDAIAPITRMFVGEGENQPVIAGGFLRDVMLGVPYSDVDVYVYDFPGGILSHRGPYNFYSKDQEEYDHQYISATTRCDVQGLSRCVYDVNFIRMRMRPTVYNVTELFDFGLCKVAWSQLHGLLVSPAFLHDRDNRVLTNYRTGWGEDGVDAHYERIHDKYPWPRIDVQEERDDILGV